MARSSSGCARWTWSSDKIKGSEAGDGEDDDGVGPRSAGEGFKDRGVALPWPEVGVGGCVASMTRAASDRGGVGGYIQDGVCGYQLLCCAMNAEEQEM